MSEEKRADGETLPDTPLHGHQDGRALDEGEAAEGGPVEQRSEGDEPLGGPTPSAGDSDADDSEAAGAADDTPQPDEDIGREGFGTQSGAFEADNDPKEGEDQHRQ